MTLVTGHINRFWDDSFKDFEYTRKSGFNQQEIDVWIDQGYIPKNLKDFIGTLYDNSNPMPDWINQLEGKFGLYNQSYTFYKMETLEIMPTHSDHYRTYSKLNNVSVDQVCRVLIMLEDWKPGHYLEIDGVGYVNWRAGDWFKWSGRTPHAASNIGIEPRHTLQITGLTLPQGRINNLFTINIPDIEHDNNIDDLFFTRVFMPYAIPQTNHTRKVMLYTHNQYIKELDTINHTSKIEDTIHIYLFEPMCSYLNSNPLNLDHAFCSEFTDDFDIMDMRSLELDSIYDYAQRNDLKVKVYTCDYGCEKYYPYYSDRIELACDDMFLRGCVQIENLPEEPNLNFNKRFISLNWRFAKHRQMIATYLANEDGYLSWYYSYDLEGLQKHQTIQFIDLNRIQSKNVNVYNKLRQNCDIVQSKAPFIVDMNASSPVTIINHSPVIEMYPKTDDHHTGYTPSIYNKDSCSLEQYYMDAFVDIVTESRFAQPTANISEKILQAIQYQKPFVLVAPPHSLAYLKSFGFKTFSDFWDESYDVEENHEERLLKIFNIIDYILSKDIDELREIYKQMLPIVQHNLEVFKNLEWNRK